MGAVYRPKGIPMGFKKIIENAVRDFTPDVKDDVVKILESRERTGSEEKLREILGQDKSDSLSKKIRTRKN
jgi:hypothetical protein